MDLEKRNQVEFRWFDKSWFLCNIFKITLVNQVKLKLCISNKLFVSYILVILLSIMIGAYAIIQLNTLSKTSSKIINAGIPLIYTSEKMLESLTAQSNFEKRYFVLRNETSEQQFFSRAEEFKKYLDEIQGKGGNDLCYSFSPTMLGRWIMV